jgi:hypothetical protein
MFTDEATIHMNGHVNRHKCCIWGLKRPHKIYKHVQNSVKVNVWCGIMHGAKDIRTTNIYLDMLQVSVFPRTDGIEQEGEILCQQDGAPLHLVMRYEVP